MGLFSGKTVTLSGCVLDPYNQNSNTDYGKELVRIIYDANGDIMSAVSALNQQYNQYVNKTYLEKMGSTGSVVGADIEYYTYEDIQDMCDDSTIDFWAYYNLPAVRIRKFLIDNYDSYTEDEETQTYSYHYNEHDQDFDVDVVVGQVTIDGVDYIPKKNDNNPIIDYDDDNDEYTLEMEKVDNGDEKDIDYDLQDIQTGVAYSSSEDASYWFHSGMKDKRKKETKFLSIKLMKDKNLTNDRKTRLLGSLFGTNINNKKVVEGLTKTGGDCQYMVDYVITFSSNNNDKLFSGVIEDIYGTERDYNNVQITNESDAYKHIPDIFYDSDNSYENQRVSITLFGSDLVDSSTNKYLLPIDAIQGVHAHGLINVHNNNISAAIKMEQQKKIKWYQNSALGKLIMIIIIIAAITYGAITGDWATAGKVIIATVKAFIISGVINSIANTFHMNKYFRFALQVAVIVYGGYEEFEAAPSTSVQVLVVLNTTASIVNAYNTYVTLPKMVEKNKKTQEEIKNINNSMDAIDTHFMYNPFDKMDYTQDYMKFDMLYDNIDKSFDIMLDIPSTDVEEIYGLK